jgi:hypothetical protein
MDDEIRPVPPKVRNIIKRFLSDDVLDSLNACYHRLALLEIHVGKALVACDSRVRQQTDGYLAQFCSFVNDIEMAWMNKVSAHRNIDMLSQLETPS